VALQEKFQMIQFISRRDALKGLALAAGALGTLSEAGTAGAAALPHLTSSDPTAMALGYVDDAKLVDAKKNPSYQPGQLCSNCLQLQGVAGQAWRPCNIFPGKVVNANGWCRTWIKKA